MKRTLIVVDMQVDFIGGSLGTPDAQAILPAVINKIHEYQDSGDEIIFTQDSHGQGYLSTMEGKKLPIIHCIIDTPGWKIPTDIDIPSCEHIDKDTFGYPEWIIDSNGGARQLEHVEIIGLCTDICVISNAIMLKTQFPEADICVNSNCCAGTTPELHEAALKVMRSCQITVI